MSARPLTAAFLRLKRIADALEGDRPVAPADAAAFAQGIQKYLAGADLTGALGMQPKRGEHDPRHQLAYEQPNALIRRAAARFFPQLTGPHAQALAFHSRLKAYGTTAWLRERSHTCCPPRHTGRLEADLWEILKLHDHVLGMRALREILGRKITV